MKKIFFIFTAMLSQISYANTLPCKNFCFHGHPINPACVDAIIGDLGGGTDRVNLTRCEVKNHHNGFTATLDGSQQKGYYSVITCDATKPKSTCTNDAYGAYKVIAKTPNDTFVINTYYSGGGTGDFSSTISAPYNPRAICSDVLLWGWYQKVPASGATNS